MSEVAISAASIPSPVFLPCRRTALSALLSLSLIASPILANAQSGTQDATQQAATPAQQKIAPVTTTVLVHGDVSGNYLPESVTVGTLDGEPLKNVPLSATVITRDLLSDQVSRLLSDVVKNDASIDDDYVPVGYYGVYEIRGFPIDLATGLEVNGMPVAGEQDVPLENKQSVELLKGIAGVESGVASAGGLIDYVTKRPELVKAIDAATDQRGSAYGAVDFGSFFGKQKQVGTRLNLAGERIASYMNDTNGWRAVGAGAADWKINSAAILKGDFEYQHKTERDGSGYQLLGGTALPNINAIYPSTMLGDQPWGPPDTYDTFNTGARLDYTLPHNWLAFAAASYSHSLIQDNVIYAYGCYYEAECNTGGAPYPWFFAPDGTYDVYDYRDPGELRVDAEAEAMVTGHLKTGAITQDLAIGGEIFRRTVQLPGFYSYADPYSSNGIVQDGAVYTYVGSENIYQPSAIPFGTPASLEYPVQTAGPQRLWEDSHQTAGIVQDRIHLPGHFQLIAGGRYDFLHDHNYSYAATTPCSVSITAGPANDPCPTTTDQSGNPIYSIPTGPSVTDQGIWLPQYAVTYNPAQNLTLYGNYAVMLSLGLQGPFWTDNGSQFLSPFFTRQNEIGAKYEPGQRILITGALFRMHAPFFYPMQLAAPNSAYQSCNVGDLCFVSEGREAHDGAELNAQGKVAAWLRVSASAEGLRATSTETGTPAFDNKQVINVPRLHTTAFADVTMPGVRGLHLMPGWSYSSRKEATRDDLVSVPAVNLFNFGMRYTPGGEQGRITFRIFANNIADKRYWSDTGASYGDSFLWLGAPTTVRLSMHYSF